MPLPTDTTYILDAFDARQDRWLNAGTGTVGFTPGVTGSALTVTTPANASVEAYRVFWSALLAGYDTLSFDVNFNGTTFLTASDTPILVFDQNGWKGIRLANFATNGVSGWQHISIPLAKFTANYDATPSTAGTGTALDPAATIASLRVRIYETTAGRTLSLDNLVLSDPTNALKQDFTQPTFLTTGVLPSGHSFRLQSADVMKWSKDDLFSQKTDAQMAAVALQLKSLGATHVAVATPYDDPSAYPGGPAPEGYLERWIVAIRGQGMHVFFRRQWLSWEGIYGVAKNTARGIGTTPNVLNGTDTTSYLALTYLYWKANAGHLVQAGDIVCPCPEPENGGINGVTGSAPYQFTNANLFRAWLRDAVTVVNQALEPSNLKGSVFVGLYGTSGFIVFGNGGNPKGFLDDRTVEALAIVGMDDYPTPASNMGADLDAYRALYQLPLALTEWGTINESNDADRQAAIDAVTSSLKARPWTVGMNYWSVIGGANEDILDAAAITPKAGYARLQAAYGGLTPTAAPALLSYLDYERQTNQTLSDPDGQTLANTIAEAIITWAEDRTGRTFTKSVVTDYFDGGSDTFDLTMGPVDLTQPLSVGVYNDATNLYEPYSGWIRSFDDGTILLQYPLTRWFRAVQITYTAGYAALPADLKHALTELLTLKFDAAGDDGQTLKRVSTGQYTEEYVTPTGAGDLLAQIPMDILEVVNSYRLARVY